ncbi:alpha/beta hydrolase [Mangrovibacterium lignilyticum]|uniref:alpha/beta hydrolase n=1 Tax=Mangrovibacterium lignilyticum TaxID=2668052 RepID=UPI0013D1E60F|nr:alpha/beta hydrolase [Mangrovibacterium lignilyticum]
MNKTIQIFSLLFINLIAVVCQAQTVIPLYNGEIPPGSEILTRGETARRDENGDIITIRNVSMPTLTVVRPEEDKKNGTALIICPGGGFQGLAFQHEGAETAKWCIEKGITAFILKYRLMPFPYPELDRAEQSQRDSIFIPFVRLAAADGLEAIKYVRSHASEFGIDPAKIGIVGYSAGGTVTGSVARTYTPESRPDFVVPVYAYCGAILGDRVPEDAPPMFLAWATDDPIAKGNPGLYEQWRDTGKSVEMHCFYSGGHGFSVVKQNKPSDQWPTLFEEWMINQGFLNK